VTAVGFNINKGELWHCTLDGTRGVPVFILHGRDRFDPEQPRTALANYFKQTFNEIISRASPDRLAYRLSLDAKSAGQIAYLCFSFGILNLIAHELSLPLHEFTSQSFTKRALGFSGNKFDACDEMIEKRPMKWGDPEKLAALAAWMTLDA
jgi:hypothetical protein